MTRYFHNYPKVLCTFQILSQEMKSPKQIGGDLSPAFRRYAPVVNYLTFAIPQSGSLAWMAGVAFPGEKFHIFHRTIFFHRSPLMHPSKCSPLWAVRWHFSICDDVRLHFFNGCTMSRTLFRMFRLKSFRIWAWIFNMIDMAEGYILRV